MRLKLCMLMEQRINLLILDEPTNHLDIPSREWMEAAVEEFDGTLLFVSHDRYFVDHFATRIWELDKQQIQDYPFGYQKYRAIKEREAVQKPAAVPPSQRPKRKSPGTPAIWKNRLQSWSGKSKSRSSWWLPMNRRLRRQLRITRN